MSYSSSDEYDSEVESEINRSIKESILKDEFYYKVQDVKIDLQQRSTEFYFFKNFSTQTMIDHFETYEFIKFPYRDLKLPINIFNIVYDLACLILGDEQDTICTSGDIASIYNQLKYIDDYSNNYEFRNSRNTRLPPIPEN